MKKAKEIMHKKVVTIGENDLLSDAVKLMVKNKCSVLPVTTGDQRVLGIITEKDLLHLVSNPDEKNVKVSDLMECNVTCFDENDDIANICECLRYSSFRSVPIVSKGRLVGLVTRYDIVKQIEI